MHRFEIGQRALHAGEVCEPGWVRGMRKVLHVGPAISKGGMGAVIQLLASSPPEGWNSEILPSHNEGGAFAILRAWWSARKNLKIRLRDSDVDIVHIHTASNWSWTRKKMLIKIARKADIPVVLSIHSGDFDKHCRKNGNSVKDICKETSTYPVVLSEIWMERLSKWIENPAIIANPVPDVDSTSIRNKNSFLLMGRSNPMKGQKIIIDAAQILLKEGFDFTIHMTGISGNYPGVTCHGWVEGEKRDVLLSTCGTLLSPSKWEGLSMTVIEAMARGMPILASSASTGVFINSGKIIERTPEAFANAMKHIMTSDDWLEMSKKGPVEAEKYSLSNITKEWMSLYNQVMNK